MSDVTIAAVVVVVVVVGDGKGPRGTFLLRGTFSKRLHKRQTTGKAVDNR